MKCLLVIIALLLALPLSAYEFKVTDVFQVQEEAVLSKAAELNAPGLFIQTDILGFIDDGNSSLKTYPMDGGYFVELGFYPRQEGFLAFFMAPHFVPLEVPFEQIWEEGKVVGLRLEQTGKNPAQFNPNMYSLRVEHDPKTTLLPNGPERETTCLYVSTDLPWAEVARMFKSSAILRMAEPQGAKGVGGYYMIHLIKGKSQPKDIFTPNALMKLKNIPENTKLGTCSQGPYRVEIEW